MTTMLERTLRELGYDTRVRRAPGIDAYFNAFHRGAARVEAAVSGWGSDYPAAGGYIRGVLLCSEAPYACNPAAQRQIRRTLDLETRNPEAANRVWRQLDRELVDQALVVPVTTGTAIDFVSKRVGNYQRHPVLGILRSQIWVRQ